MNIVHISPNAPYNDYWGYQENILPKYHKRLGHNVTLIITNRIQENGTIREIDCADYVLNDGVRVIRKKTKKYCHRILTNLKSKIDVYDLLVQLKADYVFFHGLVSSTIYDVVKYKKKINPNCIIVQDNHLDYNIGFRSKGIKLSLTLSVFRRVIRKTQKYVSKYFGVTPWRKQYAIDMFKVPINKADVLIMGADDEKIDFPNRERIRNRIRKEYGIRETDFLIVTGGKIDKKKKIHLLMQACMNVEDVKLLVFGKVHDDVKDDFDRALQNCNNIKYIGWIDADSVYDYFFASDLAFFPGQHSVLWEQACASKVPCVFEMWTGMDHVNNGGNSDFVNSVTVETITKKINELKFTDRYAQMLEVANSSNTDIYLYSNIARKSLELK